MKNLSTSQRNTFHPIAMFTPPPHQDFRKGDFHVPIRTDACNFASLAGSIVGKGIEGMKFKGCPPPQVSTKKRAHQTQEYIRKQQTGERKALTLGKNSLEMGNSGGGVSEEMVPLEVVTLHTIGGAWGRFAQYRSRPK